MTLERGYADTGELDMFGVRFADGVVGPAVHMRLVKPNTLSALVLVQPHVAGLTMTAKWQVSNDKNTWYDAGAENNEVEIQLDLGTGFDVDTPVTTSVDAVHSAYGWEWARCGIAIDGAGGTAEDTYRISYNFELVRK